MTNVKNIEAEVRGLLSKDEFDVLNSFLSKNSIFKQKKERVLIDFSSGVRDRKKDIRVRETNGIPEIIIKLGAWGGSEKREEISIHTEKGSFDDLVRAFGELGYTKGVLCVRNSLVYDYKNVEFALVEVPGHSYYFEAEILATAVDAHKAEAELLALCEELKLKTFTDEGFYAYIETLNREANSIFDYAKYEPGYFRDRRYLNK